MDAGSTPGEDFEREEIGGRFARLVANLNGMVYRCRNDPLWTMEYVSPGSLGLTGYAPGQLQGNREVSYGQLIHPDDRETVWETIQEALGRGQAFTLTYRLRDRSGALRWVWEQGCGVRSPDGGLAAIEGFITDISALRRAEAELKEVRDIVASCPTVVFLCRNAPGWPTEVVTENVEQIFGWSAGEFMSGAVSYADLVHPEDRERVGREVAAACARSAREILPPGIPDRHPRRAAALGRRLASDPPRRAGADHPLPGDRDRPHRDPGDGRLPAPGARPAEADPGQPARRGVPDRPRAPAGVRQPLPRARVRPAGRPALPRVLPRPLHPLPLVPQRGGPPRLGGALGVGHGGERARLRGARPPAAAGARGARQAGAVPRHHRPQEGRGAGPAERVAAPGPAEHRPVRGGGCPGPAGLHPRAGHPAHRQPVRLHRPLRREEARAQLLLLVRRGAPAVRAGPLRRHPPARGGRPVERGDPPEAAARRQRLHRAPPVSRRSTRRATSRCPAS